MSPDRHFEAKALSRFAAEMEPDVRASFLRQACSDEELRAQAEMFIALYGNVDGCGGEEDGQARAFVRRRGLKVAAAAVALVLLCGALVAAWQAGTISAP